MLNTNNQSNTLLETGFLRLPQVLSLIPIGKSTWWAGVKSGRFPPSIKLGPRTTVWRAEEIQKFIDNINANRGL